MKKSVAIKPWKNSERGTVLMLVVIFTFIVSIVGLATINLAGLQEISARADIDVARAINMADAGLEYGKVWLSSVCAANYIFPELAIKFANPGLSEAECRQPVFVETVNVGQRGSFSVSIMPADNSATVNLVDPFRSLSGSYIISSTGTIHTGCMDTVKSNSVTIDLWKSSYVFVSSQNLPVARGFNTITPLTDGKILITGGDPNFRIEMNHSPVADAELFDPAGNNGAGSFEVLPDMNVAREKHTATLLSSGTLFSCGGDVLIAGGFDESNAHPAQYFEIYNHNSKTFTKLAAKMLTPRICHDAVYILSKNWVLLVGGFVKVTKGSWPSFPALNISGEIFDLNSGACLLTNGNMQNSRHCFTVTPFPDGRVLIAGGALNTVADPNNCWATSTNTADIYPRYQRNYSYRTNEYPEG
jgi:hypothetical protein